MNARIFRNHFRDFYPLITKLVCCDQVNFEIAKVIFLEPALFVFMAHFKPSS